jgi:hypothetical protein
MRSSSLGAQVAVRVKRDRRRRVAEGPLHRLDRAACRDQRRGVGVAQVVEPNRTCQPGGVTGPPPPPVEVPVPDRLAILGQHEPVVAATHVSRQLVEHPRRRRDDPMAGRSLRWREAANAPPGRPLAVHHHGPAQPVDAIGGEPGHLARPHAESGAQHDCDAEPRGRGIEQRFDVAGLGATTSPAVCSGTLMPDARLRAIN